MLTTHAMLITTFVLSHQTIMDYGMYNNMQECQAMVEALQTEYIQAKRTEEVYCTCVEILEEDNKTGETI